jgi:hypothetical protein
MVELGVGGLGDKSGLLVCELCKFDLVALAYDLPSVVFEGFFWGFRGFGKLGQPL